MNRKYTWDTVSDFFKSQSYKLITPIYTNCDEILETICPAGHKYFVRFKTFQKRGHRCTECSGQRKKTFEEVKDIIEKEGYTLLSKTYTNNKQKLEILCPEGHKYNVRLANFDSLEQRCSKCAGLKKLTQEEVEQFFRKRGEILISQYINCKTPLEVQCKKGHIYKIVYNNASFSDQGCKICYSGPGKKKTFEEVKNIIKKENYKLISDTYTDARTKLELVCPNEHSWTVSLDSFVNGEYRCPKCSLSHVSRSELKLLKWINQYYPSAIKYKTPYSNNSTPKFFEYDIFVPELKLAIEYNGLYWHSEQFKEDKNYHFRKMIKGFENGFRTITIFEDEWLHRQDQVKNFLLSVMNKNTNKIMARKTILKEVPKNEASEFLNDNHIQGTAKMDIAFGLYYQDELIGLITGSKHHRQGQDGIFVLNRLAFKSNTSVTGGSSKLLNTLVQYAKNNGYHKMISWSDNRYSIGTVYEKLGFVLEEELPPDYSYVSKDKRISKQSCQKKHLLKKGGVGKTEKEMANSLGLFRIYDCGKKRWSVNL
jgi:GNAT superfamily N-acetyltransferase